MQSSSKNPSLALIDLAEKLSPLEKKIVPFLTAASLKSLQEKSGIDEVSVLRALKFLEAKKALALTTKTTTIVDLGTNGVYYKKNHLPERRLLIALENNETLPLSEAQKNAKLSENEFKASLGTLKNKAMITLTNGKVMLSATKEELIKKSLEEQLLELLPRALKALPPEMLHAVENLKKRKEIIEIREEKEISFTLTHLGKELTSTTLNFDLIEEVTPELIQAGTKGKKFRKYDLSAPVPAISGGKRHFVNQAIKHGKNIWIEMGFKEMSGPMIDTSFWVFDALFTPQDHPAREMQDTFFIKNSTGTLPRNENVKYVKKAHESGVGGSRGWQYPWKEEEAKKVLLRTHTTCLSAKTLASLRNVKDKAGKYFSVGKCFRNETLDWSHGFEFNQTEGIVIHKEVNFRHLLGYLKEFFTKMGFSNVKFVPSFFAYTEPSVEIYGYHQGKKTWIEIGGAGIFRPEVVIPLLGEYIPVLAWGPGFDRIIMDEYEIKDLREMYENDIQKLRNKKAGMN